MALQTDIGLLQPEFRTLFERFLRIVRDDLGLDVRVSETLRTADRQLEVEANGASKNKIGWHNFGMAADIGCYHEGVYQKDDTLGYYLKCGFVGMALGFRWGGNWDRDKNIGEPGESDLGHFEYHPGRTLQQVIDGGLHA